LNTLTDKTDHGHAEEQLQIFKRCIDLSPDAIFQIDSEGHLLYVNDAACRALVYDRGELLPMGVHVMPEITGMRLAERMLGLRPDLPIILSAGYCETVSAEEAIAAGISEFLMKPIESRALAETVRRVVDSRASVPSRL
jgi:DNA-binding NarL/FixJ family response regulator